MLSHIEIQKALAYGKIKKYHSKPFSTESFLQESAGQACFVDSVILIMRETLKFRSRKTIQYINVHAKVLGKDLIFFV